MNKKQWIVNVIAIVLTLHVLAAAGFVGWLYRSGRMNKDRVHRLVDLFRVPVDQEKAEQAKADVLAQEAKKKEADLARMEKLAAGPLTQEDRIREESQADDIAMQRYERLQRETADLRRQLDTAKVLLNQQKAELDAQRKTFTETVQRDEKLKSDESFQQAVEMYQQLKAPQVKSMFQDLLKEGKTEQVIDYLAAMQQRKAAAVLKEFKTPEEIAQATDLMQRLRSRGVNPMNMPADNKMPPAENPT